MSNRHSLRITLKASLTYTIITATRKVHYKFYDGREMVEEYNSETGVLSRRAWKKNNILKSSKWEVEVGDPLHGTSEESENIGLFESKDSVNLLRFLS